jgi:hypothetical protein
MAAATFTTWADLYAAMLNALADFVANRIQVAEYEISSGGIARRFKYRSFDELNKALKEIKHLADLETGAASGRTYASNSGGRWS